MWLPKTLLALLCVRAAGPTDVPTFHYDNARLGWNAHETRITLESLRREGFGKLWQAPTDGLVWGAPVLAGGVLFAATDRNSVYAFNASTGRPVWARRELASPLSEAQFTGTWGAEGWHGILSTPVIDTTSRTLYVCGLKASGLRQYYLVWALDLATGATRSGFPVRLKGADRGTPFEAGQIIQRGALSLVNGRLIIPFGGRGDVPPWRGWVVSLDVKYPSKPPLLACASPFTDGAGVWSGGGVAASDRGELFAATGNGTFDCNQGGANASECILRLEPDRPRLGMNLSRRDSYTPSNYAFLDDQDEDLGGSSINVLPDFPGPIPHLLFIAGKDGVAYLLNRDRLGGVGGEVQKFRIFSLPDAIYHEGVRSTSAYWDSGPDGRFVYVAGDEPGPLNHGMVALKLVNDPVTKAPRMVRAWTLTRDFDNPSSPVVSSNGLRDGIVWVVETGGGFGDSGLLAYEGLTGAKLFDSTRSPRDRFTKGRRFTSPVIADGRVYVPARGVVCFGFREAEK